MRRKACGMPTAELPGQSVIADRVSDWGVPLASTLPIKEGSARDSSFAHNSPRMALVEVTHSAASRTASDIPYGSGGGQGAGRGTPRPSGGGRTRGSTWTACKILRVKCKLLTMNSLCRQLRAKRMSVCDGNRACAGSDFRSRKKERGAARPPSRLRESRVLARASLPNAKLVTLDVSS
jgi:hypothetical protein